MDHRAIHDDAQAEAPGPAAHDGTLPMAGVDAGAGGAAAAVDAVPDLASTRTFFVCFCLPVSRIHSSRR